jgi:amidase
VATFPPRLNGDRSVTSPGALTWIASGLHWPAVVVPMGFTYEDLPSGLQIVGQPWSDLSLLEMAYAYEQASGHRRAPGTTPVIRTAQGATDD